LIFGHSQTHWGHNLIVLASVSKKRIQELELIPVSGVGDQLFQPAPLAGTEAEKTLSNLEEISKPFGTKIRREGDRGMIS